jgi:beta-lactam-binding protein with PASTA domain
VESASPPPRTIPVPNFLTGHMTLENAIAMATPAKIYLSPANKTVTDPKQVNIIVDQNPKSGSVPEGSTVAVWIGTTNRSVIFAPDLNIGRLLIEHRDTVRRTLLIGTNH